MIVNDGNTLKTKWGNARIDSHGYYQITSNEKGYGGKFLHRLIYAEHHGEIPDGVVIHHIDENPLNNDISNLEPMSLSEHASIHNKGEKNSMYGKFGEKSHRYGVKLSDEIKQKISKSHTGKKLSDNHKRRLSASKNTTGIKNVYKAKDSRCTQGFVWKYQYYEGKKRKAIGSTDLQKLEEKVKSRGLPWVVLKEE